MGAAELAPVDFSEALGLAVGAAVALFVQLWSAHGGTAGVRRNMGGCWFVDGAHAS